MNKEKIAIVILAVSLLIITTLYLKSLATIQDLYTSSAVENLESMDKQPLVDLTPATDPVKPIELPPSQNEEPIVIQPTDSSCYVGGCSSQLCGDASILDMATTCEWREEYTCYQNKEITSCKRQSNGKCGWTETTELKMCLSNASVTEGHRLPTM